MPRAAAEVRRVDVVGVGLNATDTVIALERYPEPGSKVEFRTAEVLPGGQVATAVVACQQWGLRTRYVGKLGEDDGARLHREAFARAGVEARLLTAPGAASPQSLVLVDSTGERTVLCRRDERLALRPEELCREWVTEARALLVDGFDTEAAVQAARWARAAGVPVIADLDELYPRIDELLPEIDYLIVSRDFPCRVTGEPDLETGLRRMQARYRSRLAAATLGVDGVLAWDGQRCTAASAYRVPVADTTGAGDMFHAGFIYGLLARWPLRRQLDFACAAAALNCMHKGARGGIATVAAIEALMASGERYLAEESMDEFAS